MIKFIVLSFIFFSLPALAQPVCDEHDKVLKHLADQYQEVPEGRGLTNTGVIFEVLTSPGGATWTLIAHGTSGKSCFLQAGENWEKLKRVRILGPRS